MNCFKIIFFILVLPFLISCSKDEKKISTINEKSLDFQVLEAYEEGMKALEDGDVIFAAKKFNEAEILFPQSEWAPKSSLMAAYAYYLQDYYGDAIAELERFVRVYSSNKNLDYGYYLLALSYYEQIADEKKDLNSIIKAKENFQYLLNNFPNTEYALDAELKLDLINDILASKEMFIGRYYFEKKKWIPAINRFRNVLDYYQTTIYVEEALHRLVEIYYIIGLKEESQKYAILLGYNYGSSEWYKKTYSVFDKKYKFLEKNKDKQGLVKKFKSLFN